MHFLLTYYTIISAEKQPLPTNEYESSKAVPNQAILGKMERALEIKLRGKDKGAPLAPKAKKAQAK